MRWLRWHCPPDTGFEIRALAVWGRARYLSVTEAPHNTNFHTWMGKKHFCFFQTAETGNRTPDSGVKGSGANHYPRAPAQLTSELTSKWITFTNIQSNFTLISLITFEVLNQTSPNLQGSCRNTSRWCLQNYMETGLELTSKLTSKWITFKNIQSNFTLISLITFEVLNQTSSNYQGSCRNTSRWCLQN